MINEYIKSNIKNHALESAPLECCGFIVNKDSNRQEFIKSKNFSKQSNCFEISPAEYLNIKNNYDILYIYHSHPNTKDENFSYLDKQMSKNLLINLILYIIDLDIFKIYNFKNDEVIYG